MRIDDLSAPVTQSAERTNQIAQLPPGARANEAVPASDQAEVSALARALSTQDPARIDQLRLEVQSGKYDVPAQAVASAIVDAHLTE